MNSDRTRHNPDARPGPRTDASAEARREQCECGHPDCSRRLQERLRDFVLTVLSDVDTHQFPGLTLPATDAGHPIRADARVDLAYVLALLLEQGIDWVADTSLRQRIHALLTSIDGPSVDGFFSYRIAEAARVTGGLDALPLQAAHAVVTGSAAAVLNRRIDDNEQVRNNFLVVAARCDHERQLLGLDRLTSIATTRPDWIRLFESGGWITDDPRWPDNFDIYSPEMYLLTEPFAAAIGTNWTTGFNTILDDLDALCSPRGAVAWGRSVGVLSECMTIELGALAAAQGRRDSPAWLGRASHTLSGLQRWFDRGLITAHRHRTSDSYRGPSRRVQMTFDVLGKLLVAARWLAQATHTRVENCPDVLWADVDEYVRFGPGDAGAWAYRSRDISFVVPVVGGPTSQYAVAPRWPGLFEQPPQGPPTLMPYLMDPTSANRELALTPDGNRRSVSHRPGRLEVVGHGWSDQHTTSIEGSRTTTFTVSGRLLAADEQLTAGTTPAMFAGVNLAAGRQSPVIGSVSGQAEIAGSTVEGIAAWQTAWGSYDRVDTITARPPTRFTWRIGRGLRIASSDFDHPYNQALYERLPVSVRAVPAGRPDNNLASRLDDVDYFHLAWPERWAGRRLADNARAIADVQSAGVKIVWTMHNLAPHRHSEEGAAIYEAWGAAADVVIHHSEYGRKIAVERYDFDGRTTHVVISHGHWAHLMNKYAIFDRDEVESDEGWPKASLRLAVVGQPRTEKHLADVIEAARSCGRDDIQFVIRCDPQHHHLSTQKVRLEHGHLSPERYYRRFAAYDGLILPFEEGQMLGSGTVFDSIGAGIAAIGTDWGFQTEMLGEALITYKTDTLRDTLHRMTPDDVARSATAVRALQPRFDWAVAGRHTAATLLERDGIDPVDGHDGQLAFRHVESR